MELDSIQSEANYNQFLSGIIKTEKVWGLKHPEEGFAFCESNEFEDAYVVVFWSDEASAEHHAEGEWSEYQVEAIEFGTFLEKWLKNLHEEELLVGPNWDENLCGLEVEPLDILQTLLEQLD